MPVVFLAHNGIGVGHLSRTLTICRTLTMLGEKPVLFTQCPTDRLGALNFPSKRLPRILDCTSLEAAEIARELTRFAGMAEPSVVFEDTHPSQLLLGSYIRRVLVVRPTTFDYLEWLQRTFHNVYDAFLVADSPDSPTWTYSEPQTQQILEWPNWFFLGPIYRTVSNEEFESARFRHRICDGDPICTFSMGGGGIRSQGDPDMSIFLAACQDVIGQLSALDPKTRFLFIRGPLFPSDVALPLGVEVVDDDPCVPAILSLSRAAVIRPGFNTVWECLAGGTLFIPILGTWYQEPMEDRLRVLYQGGYAVSDLASLWFDTKATEIREARIRAVRSSWTGAGELSLLARQLGSKPRPPFNQRVASRHVTTPLAEELPWLALRIDDVITLDDNCLWLLALIQGHGLRASLEVIPYLSSLCEADLDAIDPNRYFMVGQHGFAHLARNRVSQRRAEFGSGTLPTDEDIAQIEEGYAQMVRRFPSRFRGGFSAPYDGLSPWMGALWKEIGGRYLSTINCDSFQQHVPRSRIAIDTWNWGDDVGYSPSVILGQFETLSAAQGGAGIVIHPWLLNAPNERFRIEEIMGRLTETGVRPINLDDLVRET